MAHEGMRRADICFACRRQLYLWPIVWVALSQRRFGQWNTPVDASAANTADLLKAYLIATRDPTYRSTADRIRAIYFLGTPHRGADSARLAESLFKLTWYGTKAFLGELVPGSGTLDVRAALPLPVAAFSQTTRSSMMSSVTFAGALIYGPSLKRHRQKWVSPHRLWLTGPQPS